MTTLELIEAFVRGAEKGKASGGRLYIKGNKLFNYNTCIAQAEPEIGWLLNMTKYSPTTSKHQNRLQRKLNSLRAFQTELVNVPEGTQDLTDVLSRV